MSRRRQEACTRFLEAVRMIQNLSFVCSVCAHLTSQYQSVLTWPGQLQVSHMNGLDELMFAELFHQRSLSDSISLLIHSFYCNYLHSREWFTKHRRVKGNKCQQCHLVVRPGCGKLSSSQVFPFLTTDLLCRVCSFSDSALWPGQTLKSTPFGVHKKSPMMWKSSEFSKGFRDLPLGQSLRSGPLYLQDFP